MPLLPPTADVTLRRLRERDIRSILRHTVKPSCSRAIACNAEAEIASLKRLVVAMAERIAGQSELLSKKAEVKPCQTCSLRTSDGNSSSQTH